MAADTAAKRYSALVVHQPWRGPATLPSGTIAQSERQSAAGLYSGIDADDPTPPPDFNAAWAINAVNTIVGMP